MKYLSIKFNARLLVMCIALTIVGIIAVPEFSHAENVPDNKENFQAGKTISLDHHP